MAKALVRGWGTALAQLRHASGLSAAQVVDRLKVFGIEVNRASIYTYEAGKVSAPDAGVVWGLAQVYGVSVSDLIADLLADRSGGRPIQDRKAAPADQAQASALSETEANFIRLLRQLPPHKRNACQEFVRFQLQDEPGGRQRPRARQPTRAK